MTTLEEVSLELEQIQQTSDHLLVQIKAYSWMKLKLYVLGSRQKRQVVNETLKQLRDQLEEIRSQACDLESRYRIAQTLEYSLLLSLVSGILTQQLGEEYLVVTRVYYDQRVNWALSNVEENRVIMEHITVPYAKIISETDSVGLSFKSIEKSSTVNLLDITKILKEKSEIDAYPFLQSELNAFCNFKLNHVEEADSILVTQFLERNQLSKKKC